MLKKVETFWRRKADENGSQREREDRRRYIFNLSGVSKSSSQTEYNVHSYLPFCRVWERDIGMLKFHILEREREEDGGGVAAGREPQSRKGRISIRMWFNFNL